MYFCVVHGLLHCFHPCIMKSFYLVNIMFGIGFTRQVVVFSGFLVMGTRSLSFMVLVFSLTICTNKTMAMLLTLNHFAIPLIWQYKKVYLRSSNN